MSRPGASDPPDDLELFLALTLAASKAWPLVQRAFAAAGVAPSSWGLLAHIQGGEAVTPSRLAAETGVTTTTIRDQVQALVDRGLAERKPNPLDARSYLLELTPQGHADLEAGLAASARVREALEERVGELEPLRERLLELIRAAAAVGEEAALEERIRRVALARGARRSSAG